MPASAAGRDPGQDGDQRGLLTAGQRRSVAKRRQFRGDPLTPVMTRQIADMSRPPPSVGWNGRMIPPSGPRELLSGTFRLMPKASQNRADLGGAAV